MANEQQYYNPIIQAMITSAQQQHARAQLQQQAEQFKADKTIREHQLGIQEKQIEHEHEHQQGMLNVQQALAQAHVDAAKIEATKQIRDMIERGASPESFRQQSGFQVPTNVPGLPSSQAPGNGPMQFPGTSIQLPEGILGGATPEAHLQRVEAEHRAESQGSAEGAFNTQNKLLQAHTASQLELLKGETASKSDLQKQQQAFETGQLNKNIASHEAIAKLERDTQERMNSATNAMHEKIANLPYNPPAEMQKAMLVHGLNGGKLSLENPVERAAFTTMIEMGGKEIDPKDIAAARQAQTIVPVLKQLEDFAKEHASNTGIGGMLQGYGQAAASKIGYSTDIQNKLDQIRESALNIGKAVEGQTGGRVPLKQLELVLDGLASGNMKKDQILSNINVLRDLYTNKLDSVLFGGVPQFQKDIIYKNNGLKTPGELLKSPEESYVNLHKKGDITIGQKAGKWYNTATGEEIK